MKHSPSLAVLLCLFLIPLLGAQEAAPSVENTPFVFVTHVEGTVALWRADGQKIAAEINLPLFPGDMLQTGPESRCACMLENGTLVRLDRNTTVDLSAVQTASLTSQWKITTLNLSAGALQIMARPYEDELLQVRTPMGAFRFNKGVGTVQMSTDRLSYEIITGNISFSDGTAEYHRIKAGQYAKMAGKPPVEEPMDLPEFKAWVTLRNQEMSRAPKGAVRLPKKIYSYPKAVVHFAERWGSFYGEWVYNSLFGYVWKPSSPRWDHMSYAPFTNGKSIEINGEPFLVPAESWGFIPAHLGNWAFLPKSGWVWIPGAVRHSGFAYLPDEDNHMRWFVRTMDLWYFFVRHDAERYNPADPYPQGHPGKPGYPARISVLRKPLDEDVEGLLSRMDRVYTDRLHSLVRLDRHTAQTRSSSLGNISTVRVSREVVPLNPQHQGAFRGDWNPDSHWAATHKTRIVRNVRENRYESPDRPQMTRTRYPGGSSNPSRSVIRTSRMSGGSGTATPSRQNSGSTSRIEKKK